MDIIITWLSRVHQEDIVTCRQTAAAYSIPALQPCSHSVSQRGLTCLDIIDVDLIVSSTRGDKAAGCCHTFHTCLVGCLGECTLELL